MQQANSFPALTPARRRRASYVVLITPLIIAFGTTPILAQSPIETRPIEVTRVDDQAIGYATFQSHNQKVVANAHGIFMTHLRSRNEAYTAQTWRLSRSVDQGKTFDVIYEDTHATNPPVLETDRDGKVYLMRVDFTTGDGFLYRFSPDRDFRSPKVTRVPGAAAGKYSMCLDETRRRLYFFAHNNSFHQIGLDGTVSSRINLLRPGPHAILQYPHLSLEPDAGRLHAAWTTQKHGVYLYWDIHHMLSPDGQNWRTLKGRSLEIPVMADEQGLATRVTQDDEFTAHTWLSNCLARNGKVHFLYLAQTDPPRQHYLRYDVGTGKREVDVFPQFRGNNLTLQGLDGFFIADRRSTSTIYCVGNHQGYLACLVSRDDGATWHDHARTTQRFNLYSIGGCRLTTHNDWIIGSFTDQHGSNTSDERSSRVFFFRIRAAS